jgi:hypothetical protein
MFFLLNKYSCAAETKFNKSPHYLWIAICGMPQIAAIAMALFPRQQHYSLNVLSAEHQQQLFDS